MRNVTLLLTLLLVACSQPVEGPRTWYVQSSSGESNDSGLGTRDAPFTTLAAIQSAAQADDTLVVLPSPGSEELAGAIALKRGQTLRGEAGATLRGTTGDVIRLANDVTVSDLLIEGAQGHAIVGSDVHGVIIRDLRIVDANLAAETSVATGATAGLGVAEFPKGAIAFFHDNESPARSNRIEGVAIAANVRLGGPGIVIHAREASQASLEIAATEVANLGPGFPSSGILIDAQDQSNITLSIEDSTVAGGYQSSDGILTVAQHESAIAATIRRYRYIGNTPEQGAGNNGLEVVTYYGGDWLSGTGAHAASSRVLLEDSDLEGSGGFGVVVLNLFGKPSNETVLDFGGGQLGGSGRNRVFNNAQELPIPFEVFVVHDDLDMTNNWWGDDPNGGPKATAAGLDPTYAFICPGTTEQLDALASGTGINVWSMFCQTFRDDVCGASEPAENCCDPSTDPGRCLMQRDDGSLTTNPALLETPR